MGLPQIHLPSTMIKRPSLIQHSSVGLAVPSCFYLTPIPSSSRHIYIVYNRKKIVAKREHNKILPNKRVLKAHSRHSKTKSFLDLENDHVSSHQLSSAKHKR